MTIHELIEKSGFNRRTIYFYTQMELLPPPKGKGKNYEYSEEHLRRLEQIRKLQAMRYSLKEIRNILSGQGSFDEETISLSPDFFHMKEAQPAPGTDYTQNIESVTLWRKFAIGSDAELHIKWPPSEEMLNDLENQFKMLIQKIKGEIR